MTANNWLGARGWGLIASAVIGAILALDLLFNLSHPKALTAAAVIGGLLFIVGLTVLLDLQPGAGQLQWAGLGLMEIAAVIAVILTAISLFGGDVSDQLATASALVGMLGDVVIGAVTIRRRVFPVWAGWLLGISGVINFVTGQLDGGTWLRIVAAIGGLLAAAAIAGYGWVVVQRGKPAEAIARTA